MPICSYIVHPTEGRKDALVNRLNSIAACTAHPADNRELIVLVTDTPGKAEDKALLETLSELDDIDCMALSYANFEEEIHETA